MQTRGFSETDDRGMRNTCSCLLLFLIGCASPPPTKVGFITATVSSSDATGFGTPSFAGNVFWSAAEGNGPFRTNDVLAEEGGRDNRQLTIVFPGAPQIGTQSLPQKAVAFVTEPGGVARMWQTALPATLTIIDLSGRTDFETITLSIDAVLAPQMSPAVGAIHVTAQGTTTLSIPTA
jgi:hypothetical protein